MSARSRAGEGRRTIDTVRDRLDGKRCPVCAASDWLANGGSAECSHCRLVVSDAAALPGIAGDIARRLARGTVDLAREPGRGWSSDEAGMRNLAWRFGYDARRRDGEPISPGDTPAQVVAAPVRSVPHDVALAMMTRPDDRRAEAALRALAPHFARRYVLLDGVAVGRRAARFPGASVAAHPLAGDFAAQRNRLQALVGGGWVLQLDSDERPDAALLAALGWLTAAAGRDGLRSLGLPRRNLVDGVWSASYPDIQYRLNRADVRFDGRVHERPVVPFDETSLALAGALEHRLDAARVRARTRLYEGMSAGAGRPEDEALLLSAFDPIALR